MTLTFSAPQPPHLRDPTLFIIEMLVGFLLLLGITVFIDKLGTAMFHRGFAKPFYIKGRRIHHSIIYTIVPVGYGIFAIFYFMGFIQMVWSHLWISLAGLLAVSSICIAIDFIGDRFWPEIRRNVILHHEWIYSAIPAYIFIFSRMFNIVI